MEREGNLVLEWRRRWKKMGWFRERGKRMKSRGYKRIREEKGEIERQEGRVG